MNLKNDKTIHGTMLEVLSVGVLVLGESGIGKSECALDMIYSGHKLIADDAVRIQLIDQLLVGSSPTLTQNFIEIRGLGILDVKELFGSSAIGKPNKIDICVELKKWETIESIDRLKPEMRHMQFFDIKVPKFVLPVSLGRNIANLVETAARVKLSQGDGRNVLSGLTELHDQLIGGINHLEDITRENERTSN